MTLSATSAPGLELLEGLGLRETGPCLTSLSLGCRAVLWCLEERQLEGCLMLQSYRQGEEGGEQGGWVSRPTRGQGVSVFI